MVSPKEVRQHFVFVQKSKDVEEKELEKIKKNVYSLSDAELKKEITETTNQIFNDDSLLWEVQDIPVDLLHSCYDNIQGIPLSKIGLNYQEIVVELKEKENSGFRHGTLYSIISPNLQRLRKMLPIFVIKENRKYFVHDGQKRTATLAYHGEERIKAYINYGKMI